jgi:hypothetical protein
MVLGAALFSFIAFGKPPAGVDVQTACRSVNLVVLSKSGRTAVLDNSGKSSKRKARAHHHRLFL